MKKLTVDEINRAFSIMGAFLRDKGTIGEIAVYGGSAILFQFDWRETTEDVDAVVISDGNHGLVRQAADLAAVQLGLEQSWISEAVANYTSSQATSTSLVFTGLYPDSGTPGLRVCVAKPEYLLAMKLTALQRGNALDQDFKDAKMLAIGLGVESVDELQKAWQKFFPGESFPMRARRRLPELASAIKSGR